MKYLYRPHRGDYAVGENEKLYADMAKKGWLLDKRGARFSRFVKGEPCSMKYRIELIGPEFLEGSYMPPEQLAVYEDCGWSLAAHSGSVYVFSSPDSADAPEFYSDPRQQAGTVRPLIRSYILGLVITLLGCGFWAFFYTRQPKYALFLPEIVMIFICFVMAGVGELIYGLYRSCRLYFSLKSGVPLDHEAKRPALWSAARGVGAALSVLTVILVARCLLSYESALLPATADGPYILLEDMGVSGERTVEQIKPDFNEIERFENILVEGINLSENIETAGGSVWMFEDIYRAKSEFILARLPAMIARSATFTQDISQYEAVDVPGLDLALRADNGMEYIAVRGEYAYYITVSFNSGLDPMAALSRLPD